MKKIFLLLSLLTYPQIYAQLNDTGDLVRVHTIASTSAMNLLVPESGTLILNSEDNLLYVYNGTEWENYYESTPETFITEGDNIEITGAGTTASPYIVNYTPQVEITENPNGSYTFKNGRDTDVTFGVKAPKIVHNTEVAFAYSLRRLYLEYKGPLVKLRKSDGEEKDFYYNPVTNLINIESINTWRGASKVYVTTWYDQSNNGRHAVQVTQSRQPELLTTATPITIKADGVDDFLDTQTSLQIATNTGKEGTVAIIGTATNERKQYSFGVSSPSTSRWSAHLNFDFDINNRNLLFFDPGFCCGTTIETRISFANPTTTPASYILMRTESSALVKINKNLLKINPFNSLHRGTSSANFYIFGANGDSRFSNNSFTEFIQFNTDVGKVKLEAIEQDQSAYWGI